ncbi:unnamed protein product [Clavelina lepadiformis]|uniref:glutathione transferase n=1 Tax=Clavelina lepadiformis TaxID=159417 RepID=A0ABP0FWY8_CLALP
MSQQLKPILAYWDMRCLAEPIRLMLEYCGVEFVDKRYPTGDAPMYARPEWKRDKEGLGFDFPNVPYYICGDFKLTESWAIMKHIGRKYGLLPITAIQSTRCDMLEGCVEDFRNRFIYMCYTTNKEDFEAAKQIYLPRLPEDLKKFERFLGSNEWLAGDKLTYVDFAFCEALDSIQLFKRNFLVGFDKLKQYLERFFSLKAVADYRSSDRFQKLPLHSKYAYWGGSREL